MRLYISCRSEPPLLDYHVIISQSFCSCSLVFVNRFEPWHEISNNLVCATSKGSDQPAQSDQSLYLSLKYPMSVKLLTEHCLRFLSLKGGCSTGSSESTLVKMPHCLKSLVTAHLLLI